MAGFAEHRYNNQCHERSKKYAMPGDELQLLMMDFSESYVQECVKSLCFFDEMGTVRVDQLAAACTWDQPRKTNRYPRMISKQQRKQSAKDD